MLTRNQFGFYGTIAVHLLVIWVLIHQFAPIPEPKEQEIVIALGDDFMDIKDAVDPNSKEPPCPQTYIGIGVQHTLRGEITKAPPHLPAALAGIQVGDILDLTQNFALPLDVRIMRNGHKLVFPHVVPQVICYEG